MNKFADLIEENQEELSRLETLVGEGVQSADMMCCVRRTMESH